MRQNMPGERRGPFCLLYIPPRLQVEKVEKQGSMRHKAREKRRKLPFEGEPLQKFSLIQLFCNLEGPKTQSGGRAHEKKEGLLSLWKTLDQRLLSGR